MELTFWKLFPHLNVPNFTWQNFCLTSLCTHPTLTCLCVLWGLLLFLCYLVRIPAPPTLWQDENLKKCHGRSKRRRQGRIWKDRRYCQREEEEKKRLISIMKSAPGQYHDTRCFRQLLCPDLSCKICKKVTAEVNQLLFPDGLEDATSSASPLASRDSESKSSSTLSSTFSVVSPGDPTSAPLPEPFPPPPRILSPNPMTSLVDFLSPSPLGHSLPKEPFPPLGSEFPAVHAPPPLLPFLFLSPHDTLRVDPLLQAEATLTLNTIFLDPTLSQDISPLPVLSQTMNRTDSSASCHVPPMPSTSPPPPECIPSVPQSKPISKPVPEKSSPDSTGILSKYIPAVTGTDHSSPSNSDFCWWQACAEDSFPSSLPQFDFDQQSHRSLEASFEGDPAANQNISVSIQPEHFPLTNELNKKLEHHLRKRLVQHRWGLLRRIHQSLLLMRPPRDCSKKSERKSDHGLSCLSVVKGQSSKNLNVGLSQPESFYERNLEMLQLEKDEGKDKGNGPENDPKDHLLSDSQNSSGKDLGSDSDKDLDSHMVNLSGENPVVSGPSLCVTQLENVLKVPLSKKIEELSDGQIPGAVQHSWHAINQTLTPHVKSHTETKQRSLQPSLGRDYTVNTSQELSFIGPGTQQILEAHVKELYMKVLKDASFHSQLFSSTNLISEVDSKSGGFTSIRGSSKSVHGDKMGTAHSASVLDHPLPVTSHMSKEEKGALRNSLSSIHQELAVHGQRITNARQAQLLVTHSITGNTSQKQDLLVNRCPPKLPAGHAGACHEPKFKRVSSSDRVEMQQGNEMNKSEPVPMPYMIGEIFTAESMDDLQANTFDTLTNSEQVISQRTNTNESTGETTVSTESPSANTLVLQEPKLLELKKQLLSELKATLASRVRGRTRGHVRVEMQQGNEMNKSEPVPMPYVIREIFTAESMDDLQSNTFDILTSSEPVISQRTNMSDSKGETTVSTESPPANISVLQEPKLLELKKQILSELKSTLKNRVHGRTQNQASDTSLASDSLTYKASLTHDQGVSNVDVEASQVLHVRFQNSVGQRQDTWAPKHDLRWCQEENFPLGKKRGRPPGPKSEELGGGAAGLGTSQPRKKTVCIHDLEESIVPSATGSGSKSPPESFFKKQMKHFFQWLHPGIKKQENSQKKRHESSDQSRGPDKSRVAFTGTPRAQIVMTDSTKFSEAKVGPHHAACPRGSYAFFSGNFQKPQQKVEACAQGHPYSCRIPSSKVTNTSSHQQEAVLAGQSSPAGIRQIIDKNRLSQTVVAFKEHLLCQKHPRSGPRRETGQGLPAAHTTAGGTVLSDLLLLFRQEALFHNFQGKQFHTPK